MKVTSSRRQLGPDVWFDDDSFHIKDQSYPRRKYQTEVSLEPIIRQRDNHRWSDGFDSQLDH